MSYNINAELVFAECRNKCNFERKPIGTKNKQKNLPIPFDIFEKGWYHKYIGINKYKKEMIFMSALIVFWIAMGIIGLIGGGVIIYGNIQASNYNPRQKSAELLEAEYETMYREAMKDLDEQYPELAKYKRQR